MQRLFLSAVSLIAASLTLPAQAREVSDASARHLEQAGAIKPFHLLKARALRAHPGAALLDTDLERSNGRYFYDVELLDKQGRTWELTLDASSGRLLRNQRDD